MIAIDTEYIPETASEDVIPSQRPDVTKVYCEIIQIGAVRLNEEGKETEALNITVSPSFIFSLPKWLKDMTGMTDEKRQQGISFKDAIQKLNDFIGEDKNIWTFNGDWFVFIKNAEKHNVELPFSKFKRVLPKLQEWGVTLEGFQNIGSKEVCSGDLYKVLGIKLPNIEGVGTHDATHDARSLAHSVYFLEKKHG
ncbi:MAG: exonuclease domain-containing protein [Patescibacteria group bacterium UBA2163]